MTISINVFYLLLKQQYTFKHFGWRLSVIICYFFRKSCEKYLQSRVTPVLAALLAVTDTNDNLDLASENVPWKRQLWIDLFKDSKTTFYPYTEMQTMISGKEQSIPVAQTGFDNCRFKSQMPFSWIIIKKINQLLQESKSDTGNTCIC